MNRAVRRSNTSNGSRSGAASTSQRKPCSANCWECAVPDFASLSDVATASISLPMDETIPIPVMTTRFMQSLPFSCLSGGDGHGRQCQWSIRGPQAGISPTSPTVPEALSPDREVASSRRYSSRTGWFPWSTMWMPHAPTAGSYCEQYILLVTANGSRNVTAFPYDPEHTVTA